MQLLKETHEFHKDGNEFTLIHELNHLTDDTLINIEFNTTINTITFIILAINANQPQTAGSLLNTNVIDALESVGESALQITDKIKVSN